MMSSPQLHALLKSRFGYDRFLPMQEEVIESVMEGRDSLVLMPTGGGKSLCYQLPALLLDGVTLVVSPLIALMKDQVDALKANDIPAAFINSTLPNREVDRVQLEASRGNVKLLYVAPERLAVPRFREFLRAFRPSLIAVDEAHCISEWGHDFRPDYRNVRGLRHDLPGVPVIALTATATEQVRADIVEHLGFQDAGNFVASFNRPNLKYIVRPKRHAFDSLVELLRERPGESAIVYCFSRQDTEDVARDLSLAGIPALPYHAGLDPGLRHTNQDRFIGGEAPVIVATIAFGMGIDKPDVRVIIHYDMPKTLEGYYQETGRAGRDGLPSDCVLFYSYGDKIKQDYFVDRIDDPDERRRAEAKLITMVEFSELRTCRRRYLLNYFGEQWAPESCGACDVCLAVTEEFDATEIAQKVLSAVIRTGERFGAGHVIQVLRGSRAAKVLEFGHDSLSVYGIAASQSTEELRELFGLLIDAGLLVKPPGEYPTYAVTARGRDFLQRRDNLTLSRPQRPDTPAPGRSRRGRSSAPADQAALEYDSELYERLRTLRRGLAKEGGVPAFVVFGDASLQHMAYAYPQSVEGFAAIPGVGEAKLAKFGDAFLEVIRGYASENGLDERPFTATRTPSRRSPRGPSATHDAARPAAPAGEQPELNLDGEDQRPMAALLSRVLDRPVAIPASASSAPFRLLKEQVGDVLNTLAEREAKIIQLRFGLESGGQQTLEEIGLTFGVTRERIRQIEGKALRKLRHPSRSQKFLDFLKTYGRAIASSPGVAGMSGSAGGSRRSPRGPSATHEETKRLVAQGLNVGEIATERGLTQQTVLNHMERLVAAGETLDLGPLMPPLKRSQRIEAVFRAIATDTLTPVLEALGDGYAYEELRLVRLWMAQAAREEGAPLGSDVQTPQPLL